MQKAKTASFFRHPVKPERVLALGFLAVILTGGLLLALPVAGADGRSIDLMGGMFTATSAVCVTGLTIIDAGLDLSLFGQVILLLLIQVGGLGFMAFATLIMVALGRRVSLRGRVLLRDSMNQTSLSGMVRLSLRFFLMAMVIEALGALLLLPRLAALYGFKRGVWYSVFTAVSAFCNAGFDLFGSGNSITHLCREPWVLLVLSGVVVLGGLGFSVIAETLHSRLRFRTLTLHAKLVLTMTAVLLVSGTVLTLLLERSNPGTLGTEMSFFEQLVNSLFQAVTLRTAGFAGINQAQLTDTSKLLGCLYMFIGASPASTGGGVKTTTAAVLMLLVWSVVRGRERISAFGRELAADTARRCLTIVFIGFSFVMISSCVISVMENGRFAMIDILYETVSAFSTTGVSSLGTSKLKVPSQVLLMLMMYLGRVGPLTLAFALISRAESGHVNRMHYPEEKIMIG